MATTIDERVVQMRFDNKQFEAGAKESMSTLDKLKEKLNFKGVSKEANDELGVMLNNVDGISVKFDAMSVIAVSALNRITNAAITTGKNLIKSLSVDQVTGGYTKYEQMVASTQTLVNATGLSMEKIDEYMRKLMWYSDETSYGFTDMTSALGTMVAAGGDIDKLIPLLEGVGNATSFVGKGAAEFSRAIIQLTQGYGRNALMLEDWKSIEQTLGGAKQLKQVFIEAAEELGKIKKGEIDIGKFNESLRDKWLDQEVMEKAFGEFAAMTEKAYQMVQEGVAENAAEAYEMLGKSFDDYRLKAATAAQEAKTFGEAIDATKDAVSSGWMESFKIIFGNYKEATELWTALSEELWQVFASSGDARNEILQMWKDDKGRDIALAGISEAWANLKEIIGAVKDALATVFPIDWLQILKNVSQGIKNFGESLKLSEDALNTIREGVKLLTLPIQVLVQVLRVGMAVVQNVIPILWNLVKTLLELPSRMDKVAEGLRKIFGNDRYERLANAFAQIVQKLSTAFLTLIGNVKNLISNFKNLGRTKLGESLTRLAEMLRPLAEWVLDKIVLGIEAIANADYSKITDWASNGLSFVIDSLGNVGKMAGAVVSALIGLFKQFGKIDLSGFFSNVSSSVSDLKDNIKTFIDNLGFGKIKSVVGDQVSGVTKIILGLADAFASLMSRLTPAKILVYAFGIATIKVMNSVSKAFLAFEQIGNSVSGMFKSISGMFNGVTGVLRTFQERMKPDKFRQIAISILMLAGALAVLSLIPSLKLMNAVKAMGALMGMFTIMIGAISLIEKVTKKGDVLNKLAQSMILIAAAVGVLSVALVALSAADPERIVLSLLSVVAIMGALALTMAALANKAPALSANAMSLVAMALAVNIVVKSLHALTGMDLKSIIGALISVTVVMGLLAVIGNMTRGVTFGSAAGYTLMVLDLILVAKAIQSLSKTDPEKLIKGLAAFVGVLLAFIPLALVSRLAGTEAKKMGVGVISIAAAVLLLSVAIQRIGSLDLATVAKGTVAVSAFLVLFGGLMILSNLIGSNANKMGKTFLGAAAAILMLSFAIDYIGHLDPAVIAKGTLAVSALIVLFGLLMVASSVAGNTKGMVTTMGIIIGILTVSMMLLTLLPFSEIMGAAASLGVALISFGVAMKLVSGINWKAGLISVAIMAAVVGGFAAAFMITQGMNMSDILIRVTALGVIMLALGATMKIISGIKGQSMVSTNALIGTVAVLAAAGLVMALLETMPFSEGLLEKAASLSLIMAAIGGVMAILGTVKTSGSDSLKNAGAFAIVATVIVGLVAGIGLISAAFDKEGTFSDYGVAVLARLTALIPVILAVAAVTAILGKFGASVKAVSAGALGFAEILGVLVLVVGAVGAVAYALDSIGVDIQRVMDDAQIIFYGLADIIGGTIGRLIASTGVAITAGLAQMGQNLSDFADHARPFFESMGSMDQKVLDGVLKIVEMMTLLTANDLVNKILTFGMSNPLATFGDQLKDFAPKFVDFADQLRDIPIDSTLAAGECLTSLAQLLAAIPTEGGFMNQLMGGRNFSGFGESLKSFAEGFKGYCEVLADTKISQELVTGTKQASEALSTLANSVPKSGGLLQSFFGEVDVGKFGNQLMIFGVGLRNFFTSISGGEDGTPIDTNMVKTCASAGEALAKFANKVPAAGGMLQSFLGSQDIGVFGTQLVSFGTSLAAFFTVIKGAKIDQKAVDACVKAGEAFAKFAEKVPHMGGAFEFFTGKKDMGEFGKQVGEFGDGLAAFFNKIADSNINAGNVAMATLAMDGFAALSDSVSNSAAYSAAWNGVTLSKFGEEVKKFGEHFYNYYSEINGINFDTVNASVEAAKNMMSISDALNDSGTSITNKIQQIMQDIISAAKETLGITTNYSTQFYQIGTYILEGLVAGIVDGKSKAVTIVQNFGDQLVLAFSNSVGVNSPSVKFAEIGMYMIAGLTKGISDNVINARNAIIKMGQNLLSSIKKFFGIHSPSTLMRDEVGRYIVQGIAEGITSDMSAEEAAAQKAQNILNAFKSEFDKFDLDMTTADLEYSLWEGRNPNANENDIRQKKIELATNKLKYQAERVQLANAQYQATLQALGDQAEQTQEAYNKFLQEQINMTSLASELASLRGTSNSRAFDTTTEQLELELWKKMNAGATEEEIAAKEAELLNRQLELQAQKVVTANANYNKLLGELGADADATRDAYDEYLSAQISMAELAEKMGEARRFKEDEYYEAERARFEQAREYSRFIQENASRLRQEGKTDEEIKALASEASGWKYIPYDEQEKKINTGVKEIMDEFIANASAVVDAAGSATENNVVAIVDEFMANASDALAGYSPQLEIVFTEAVSNAVSAGGSGGVGSAGSVGADIADALSDGFESNVELDMGEVLNKITDEGIDGGEIAGMLAGKSWGDKFHEWLQNGGTVVEGWVDGFFGWLRGDSQSGGEDTADAMADGYILAIDSREPEVVARTSTFLTNIGTTMEQVSVNNATKAGNAAMSSYSDSIGNSTSGVSAKAANLISTVGMGVANTGATIFAAAGSTSIDACATGMDNNVGKAKKAATDMVTTAGNAASTEASSRFRLAGENAAAGMAAGMNAKAHLVKTASDVLANIAATAAMKRLDEHSPSRVFHQIGQYIDQGLANGIMDDMSIVMKTVNGLASNVAKAGNDMTIRPVMDLSNWNSAMRYMENDFYNTVLQWDSTGELIPYGMTNSSKIDGKWLKVDKATAQAVRAGDYVLREQAYRNAMEGNVHAGDDVVRQAETWTLNQYNYSPKALSTAEIYRNSKNQFNQIKTVVDSVNGANSGVIPSKKGSLQKLQSSSSTIIL